MDFDIQKDRLTGRVERIVLNAKTFSDEVILTNFAQSMIEGQAAIAVRIKGVQRLYRLTRTD